MTYYVLSAKQEKNCPLSLAEEKGLYDRFYSEADSTPSVGYFPWYSFDTRDSCKLPKDSVLIVENTFYDFPIRNISSNIYAISESFLSILNDYNLKFEYSPLKVISKNGKKAVNKDYFLIRFPYTNSQEVIDSSKSEVSFDDGLYSIKKIKIHSKINTPLFLIGDVIHEQRTFFASQEFVQNIKKKSLKGINFFIDSEAKWKNPIEFLDFLFDGEGSIDEQVWPL
ncbi:hypothetical protein ABGV49_03075 [Chromobacterium vaccinii]|uniref:Immunity protein 43 domain-containing protein n=1 Tax=Chromobacterium vaccinii TaxID=1108595 RepID=A0ABV0FAH4_9NEIS